MEDGELTARRHFHFLLAGFPAQSIHLTTCYWMAHKWEELGGGMARIRQFNPALTGVGYITKCLSGPDGGDLRVRQVRTKILRADAQQGAFAKCKAGL